MAEKINGIFANDMTFSVTVLLGAFLLGILLYFVVMFLLRKWQKSKILNRIKIKPEFLSGPLALFLPALCVMTALPAARFPEGNRYIISHVISIWLILSIGWFLMGVINAAREALLRQFDIKKKDNLRARQVYTQIRVIENVIDVVIVLITAALILMTFEKVRQIGTSLLASAGVIGIILGFAAQKTLGNFIAGLQIALAQPIRIDDVVIVENEWGWIEEITLTYVVVRIWDLRRLVVPISYFIENPFQNWTRVSADILGSVFIYADYTVPVKELRDELTRLLNASQYWDKKVNVLQVTNATAQTVEIRALMSAEDSPTAWNLRCEVREKLLEFLQERYPQCLPRTRVELKETPCAKS